MTRATTPASQPFDGLIIDLDGVVWVGRDPVPGSVEALRQLRAHDLPSSS
jgi:ribonucleotide monophosphatase NagD (HAD superfamily)